MYMYIALSYELACVFVWNFAVQNTKSRYIQLIVPVIITSQSQEFEVGEETIFTVRRERGLGMRLCPSLPPIPSPLSHSDKILGVLSSIGSHACTDRVSFRKKNQERKILCA